MIRKYSLPLLALCGIGFAWHVVEADNRAVPVGQPVAEPSGSPFPVFVSGTGLIESESENIEIGAPVPGLITHVFVKAGSRVKKGDPLFQLDDRALTAQLGVQKALLATSRARLEKVTALPRPVDLAPLEAQIMNATANVADLKAQLALRENVTDKRAVSADDLSHRRYAIQEAEAALQTSQASLAQLKAGATEQDRQVAMADVLQTEAQMESTQTDLDRLMVRAPFDGECLQVKVHPGEFAQDAGSTMILFGDVDHLRVRAEIDENEAWRVRRGARAKAYARGNRSISTDMTFVRFEPYVVPKKSLTGASQERVDTRVLEVLFTFDRKGLPLYVGQQMDVFIDAGQEAHEKGETQ